MLKKWAKRTSAHFPKFVLHRSDHFHELRKAMGTGKLTILVPLFYLTFLERICRKWCRNVKEAALVDHQLRAWVGSSKVRRDGLAEMGRFSPRYRPDRPGTLDEPRRFAFA